MSKELILLKADYVLLTNFIRDSAKRDSDNNIKKIAEELTRAKVVDESKFPKKLVKLNSQLSLREMESSSQLSLTLVMPAEVNVGKGKISVFAPLSIALIGCKEGEEIELVTAIGVKRYKIEEVINE